MVVFRGMGKNCDTMVRLYLLRLLVNLGAYQLVMDEQRVLEPGVLSAAGVEADKDDALVFDAKGILRALRTCLEETEALAPKPAESTILTNVEWLGQSLGLTELQVEILYFLALAHHSGAIGKVLEKCGQLRTHEVLEIIATAIGHPVDQVSGALLHTERLVKSGLVNSDLANRWGFETKISLLTGIPDQLALAHEDPNELFLSNFHRAGPPSLALADFPHLSADLQILESYLRQALATGATGVNVLVYGPPGTGKTEVVRALAEHLGAPLFEIAVEDRHGEVLRGEARFGALQLAQGVLGGDPSPMLLFDEIEDVFRPFGEDHPPRRSGNGSGRKGWVNRLLQENRVPAFWVTNTRMILDRAYLRRFDYVLEVSIPARSIRAKVLDRYLGDLAVSSAWKAMAAEHDGLTPAAVERAAKVTRTVMEAQPGLDADLVVGRVVENGLAALGGPRRSSTAPPATTTYRMDVLNTDRDLVAICAGLKRTGAGRLCLYGPPGTGKTGFGHHLAEVLDRPLLLKRASDLQSKWLGETEQNMARMFAEASADSAVLLLDEADSFLQDRRGAERPWEVSQVNEMLTQMESFGGIFIASTNLMGKLDQAALRRFELKVKFGYLGRDQILAMYRDSLGLLGLPPNPAAEGQVVGLTNLTPGDFAAALCQARLSGARTAGEFAEMLSGECAIKNGGPRRPIGFNR